MRPEETRFSTKVKGVIVDERIDLSEGAAATVGADAAEEDYAELTAEETAELKAAIVEADRGDGVPWEIVRCQLRNS